MPRGRPLYRITASDFAAAVRYLSSARDRGEIGLGEGYAVFLAATTPKALQAWCDDYLPRKVWERMVNALRQARKRSRDYKSRPLHHIDLTHPAWVALTRLAKEMGGVTLSEAVLQLEEAYDRANDAGLLMPTGADKGKRRPH